MRKLLTVVVTRPRTGTTARLLRQPLPLGMKSYLLALAALFVVVASAGAAGGLPAIGTAPENVDLRSVPGAVGYGDGYAIPLKAARPPWCTKTVR